MKRPILIGLLWLVTCGATFIVGHRIGYLAANERSEMQASYLTALNAAASYSALSDVVAQIAGNRQSEALCSVNLLASTKVNEVRKCLQNQECRSAVESALMKLAPELNGQGELRIKYYKPGELCKP